MTSKQRQTFDMGIKQVLAESEKREKEYADRMIHERGYRAGLELSSQLFFQVADLKEDEEPKKEKKKK